jgi:hypothetical protein
MFSLLKKDEPPYSVERIQEGVLLDKAIPASVHRFFNAWINKRPRKAMVGCWFILHKDATFVYWGIPVFKRLFSNDRTVEVFYKTSRKELDEQFPLYENHYQDFIWQRLYTIIKEETKGVASLHRDKALKGFIKNNQLHIDATCTLVSFKEEGAEFAVETKAQYDIVLDNKTMDLIATKQRKK